jgi:hypothetical protein
MYCPLLYGWWQFEVEQSIAKFDVCKRSKETHEDMAQ